MIPEVRQAGRQTDRQTDRQTGRQPDRQRGRQADRQADRLLLSSFVSRLLWKYCLSFYYCIIMNIDYYFPLVPLLIIVLGIRMSYFACIIIDLGMFTIPCQVGPLSTVFAHRFVSFGRNAIIFHGRTSKLTSCTGGTATVG